MLADPGPAERKRRRRAAGAAGDRGLVGDSAMLDAIREARIGGRAAEMEIGLAGMADRPFADLFVEIEQAGLVGDLRARLGGGEAARRRRRDRRLLLARGLADEAARSDRADLRLRRRGRRRRLDRR